MTIIATVHHVGPGGPWKELIAQRPSGKYALLTEHQEDLWGDGCDTVAELMKFHGINREQVTPEPGTEPPA